METIIKPGRCEREIKQALMCMLTVYSVTRCVFTFFPLPLETPQDPSGDALIPHASNNSIEIPTFVPKSHLNSKIQGGKSKRNTHKCNFFMVPRRDGYMYIVHLTESADKLYKTAQKYIDSSCNKSIV